MVKPFQPLSHNPVAAKLGSTFVTQHVTIVSGTPHQRSSTRMRETGRSRDAKSKVMQQYSPLSVARPVVKAKLWNLADDTDSPKGRRLVLYCLTPRVKLDFNFTLLTSSPGMFLARLNCFARRSSTGSWTGSANGCEQIE